MPWRTNTRCPLGTPFVWDVKYVHAPTFDMRQATLLAQAEAQSAVATAQLYAARQINDHMQSAELVSMQAIAERLDQPRELRSIKDIHSDALVKCPIDKGKDEARGPRRGRRSRG